ncbi:MAG: hypothetical protein J6U86_05845 [Clostridia bacterium]|nr:hypothetical protein [Clostridia bacterium]
MIELFGRCVCGGGEVVAGRMALARSCGENDLHSSEGAKIILWNGEGELLSELPYSAVGVVLTCRSEEFKSMGRLGGMPVLAVDDACACEGSVGSIAILDTKRQRLYVNPDFETVSGLLVTQKKDKSMGAKYIYVSRGSADFCATNGFDGVAVGDGCTDAGVEYEHLCDIADVNTGNRIIAFVGTDIEESLLISRIKSVYRAGVWGRFSLLFRDAFTPHDRERCVSAMHSAFRELDGEGREFNGFMPKGLLIQTPVMLFWREGLGNFDFYCLDIDKLTEGFCGGSRDKIGDTLGYLWKYIEEFIREAEGARMAVYSRGGTPDGFEERLLGICGEADIYTSKNI